MYLFEDSGGILPVHMVGRELDGSRSHGLGKWGFTVIAEVGNGLSSNTNDLAIESVQNFNSDRNSQSYQCSCVHQAGSRPGTADRRVVVSQPPLSHGSRRR